MIDNAGTKTGFVDDNGTRFLPLNPVNDALACKVGGFLMEGFEDAEHTPLAQTDYRLVLAKSGRVAYQNLRHLRKDVVLCVSGLFDYSTGDKTARCPEWETHRGHAP